MNEMITITREEYDRLREAAEDLADLQAYDRAKAALDAGEESYPADVVNRIVDGENPIKVLREFRGLTQMALAEASGVNRVQLVTIEQGKRTGSIATLKRIAEALSVDLDMIA
ncbi:helix-turn-helix transcriptional regulator [Paracoccus sp. PAR01]|uniref:helix-turn-helix transcriptional regulator n=1 Tax=Paracoccus sp. PAR01 TaxID=2769282 RepID=UPI00177B580D|nr:helix-turn-helix transcriptional regulator [Paracoccus sp. PAR01]MBD9528398.1 helix-turn-helix transcriptional regulator [Paracoccus sp. PAR01]